jgi:hypothetical protein
MLGDMVGELQGQITGQRVLPGEHGLPPTVETSYAATGELLGVPVNDMGSYIGQLRLDGTLYGEGQGIVMSPTGAKATFKGHGVGQFVQPGVISWRGSLVYDSDSPAFAALRGVAVVFEWETDQASGKVTGKGWVWK